MDFTVSAEHRVKVKVKEKKELEKYLNVGWELDKLCNIKVIGMLIAIGYLEAVRKKLEKWLKNLKIRSRIKTD